MPAKQKKKTYPHRLSVIVKDVIVKSHTAIHHYTRQIIMIIGILYIPKYVLFALLPTTTYVFIEPFYQLFEILGILTLIFLVTQPPKRIKKPKKNIIKLYHKSSLYFWKVLIMNIVRLLALVVLTLLGIIPGVMYMYYWQYANYFIVLLDQKPLRSLYSSYKITRDLWAIVLPFSFIMFLTSIGSAVLFYIGLRYSLEWYGIIAMLGAVFITIYTVIINSYFFMYLVTVSAKFKVPKQYNYIMEK